MQQQKFKGTLKKHSSIQYYTGIVAKKRPYPLAWTPAWGAPKPGPAVGSQQRQLARHPLKPRSSEVQQHKTKLS